MFLGGSLTIRGWDYGWGMGFHEIIDGYEGARNIFLGS